MPRIAFESPAAYNIIYIFSIDAPSHVGMLKIGETTLRSDTRPDQSALDDAARKRIKQYTNTAGFAFNLLHASIAVDNGGKPFSDRDVHRVLARSGHKPQSPRGTSAREWFKIDLNIALNAIDAVTVGKENLSGINIDLAVEKIIFRPEQTAAIKMAVKYFSRGRKTSKAEKVLWNAKMRFGKTLCALEVVRRCAFRRTIIVTHRPVVNDSWFNDFNKIFRGSEYTYGSKNNGGAVSSLLQSDAPFVYFASLQDLRGSSTVGGKFDKNSDIFNADWELVIVDEAHEGTRTALGDQTVKALVGARTQFLALSGTPFNLLDDYDADRTFTWSYVDEQRAKEDFFLECPVDRNPYAALPKIHIFTYDLGAALDFKLVDDDAAFNFVEFFRVEDGHFVHQAAVENFLRLLTSNNARVNYPFANEKFRAMFRHTLWIVPGVDAASTLARTLKSHVVFRNFEVVNVAGNDDFSGDALETVRQAIRDNDWTITISCRRLTTGVTVPEWSAVLMLAGASSTSKTSYLQTIFRVQSPGSLGDRVKTDCYVFDFAPDRTLKVLAAVAASSQPSVERKTALADFLNFAPVIAFDGSTMVEYDVDRFFRALKRACADKVFAKGFDSPLLYDSDALDDADPKLYAALRKLIEPTKSPRGEIVVNAQGFDERKSELPARSKAPEDELKAQRRERERWIGLLRAVSVRLPLMIFGAELDERHLTLDRLVGSIDERSWEEFMPRGLSKALFGELIRYYDADVFASAALKIREALRRADALAPPGRVRAIADLFSTFKNPDKETVLTPWRVVNLHLLSTLGGCDFNDERTEFKLVSGVTDKIFKVSSAVLDINSKTGLYSLHVAYSLWHWRLSVERAMNFGREPGLDDQLKLWRRIVSENIFVLCRTQMAAAVARRTLCGFGSGARVRCVENIVERLRLCFDRDDFGSFAAEVRSKSFWIKGVRGTMKFDAVVGNPPYQENAKQGGRDQPVYQYFIEAAQRLAARATLIHPARFLFNAGATPNDWNKKILLDKHWKVVKYEPDSKKLFPDGELKGGVAITYYDAEGDFGSTDIFIPFDELRSIYEKVVVNNKNFRPLSSIMYSSTVHRLSKKFHEEHPELLSRLTKGHEYDVDTRIFDRLPEIFVTKKPDDGREYIKVYGLSGRQRAFRYVRRDYIVEHETFETWKVFVPNANSAGAIGETLNSPLVGSPLVIPTQTFITVGSYGSIAEAEATFKYICTKFCRAMLGLKKVTQHNPPETWSLVPMQDFTSCSDVDWTLSVGEIDRQLYVKYGLSDLEIGFIESKVRAM